MPFQKGNPGRPKGAQNKTTRAVKEFLAELCDDPKVQRAIKAKILKGDSPGFFRALDKVVPDPPRQIDLRSDAQWVLVLPDGDDVAED